MDDRSCVIACFVYNAINIVAWCVLACYFGSWWIALVSIVTQMGINTKQKGGEKT